MTRKQQTIKQAFTISGVGLHTGSTVNMTIHPASAGHGVKFKRIDLETPLTIPATPEYVTSTNYSTTIAKKEVSVTTVEHLLAALTGLCVDNVLVEIDGDEVPILDGCATEFIAAIKEAGIEEQEADQEFIEIDSTITYFDQDTGAEIIILPAEEFSATVMIDFDSPVIGKQYAELNTITDFEEEIGGCRTFTFLNQVEYLLSQGLIKGGSLNNAVVIANEDKSASDLQALADKLGVESVAIERGILNTTQLKYDNEPARHKLLDLVGDLTLAGKPIKGKVIARKPGHTANVEMAKELRKLYQKQRRLKGLPKYDPNQAPLKNVEEIQQMLPHRYPMLLVDKIIELSDKHVVGIKNVTFNEGFFQGHFPGNSVMPGVLQIEALAQTGGILALSTVPDPGNWDTYFIKIEKTKFKHKVVPGDTLILKMELLSPIRRGICHMYGTTYVGEKIVSEGELTAQIIRRT